MTVLTLACALLAGRAIAAEQEEAVLRIADAQWMERELVRFAASLGHDPRPMRRSIAETLYHTKSLDAIDIARPALFVWPKNSTQFQAVIPIHPEGRRRFVEEFGVMARNEAPLVRVGDREGTVVYTQNTAEGVREYRMLVSDGVAYVAHNADECRRLAQRAPGLLPTIGNNAPLSLRCSGRWLRDHHLADWSWSPRMPVERWLPGGQMLDLVQNAMVSQIDGFEGEIRSSREGTAQLWARVSADAGSPLAAFIAGQQNQGSRLLTQLGGPTTAMKVNIRLALQDRLADLARAMVPLLAKERPESWNAESEAAWMEGIASIERCNEIAWMLDVPTPGKQVQTLVIEQARAELVINQIEKAVGLLSSGSSGVAAVAGFPAFRRERAAMPPQPALSQVLCATSRHVLLVDGWNSSTAETQAMVEDVVRRLQLVAQPSGDPALVTIGCDLAKLVCLAPGIDTEATFVPAEIRGSLRTVDARSLQIDVDVPVLAAAAALAHLPDERRPARR